MTCACWCVSDIEIHESGVLIPALMTSRARPHSCLPGSPVPRCRSALPWEDYEDDGPHDQNELVNSAPTADTEEEGPSSRPCTEPFRLEPRSDSLHPLSPNPGSGSNNGTLAHVKVCMHAPHACTVLRAHLPAAHVMCEAVRVC